MRLDHIHDMSTDDDIRDIINHLVDEHNRDHDAQLGIQHTIDTWLEERARGEQS